MLFYPNQIDLMHITPFFKYLKMRSSYSHSLDKKEIVPTNFAEDVFLQFTDVLQGPRQYGCHGYLGTRNNFATGAWHPS